MSDRIVRLLSMHEDGTLWDLKDEFDVDEELGGHVPAPGDYIVEPGVSGEVAATHPDPWKDPTVHWVYEVVKRYFIPQSGGGDGYIAALVVRRRKGVEAERSILCRW